jgi:ribonuclease HI
MRQLIAYTDGARRGNGDACAAAYYPNGATPNEKSLGAVVHDHVLLGMKTNNEAEYSGLILALERALSDGYQKLKVFSDSQLIVKQMQGVYRVESSSLRPLYEKAYTLACQLDFEIKWIPRAQNTEADRICNEVLDRHQGKTN